MAENEIEEAITQSEYGQSCIIIIFALIIIVTFALVIYFYSKPNGLWPFDKYVPHSDEKSELVPPPNVADYGPLDDATKAKKDRMIQQAQQDLKDGKRVFNPFNP